VSYVEQRLHSIIERTTKTLDRCWLLTWTTYGAWLPGDERGSVARVRDDVPFDVPRIKLNGYESPYAEPTPGLVRASAERMKGDPILLTIEQAEVVAAQIEESSRFRRWNLLAGSVMANHVHAVVGVPEAPMPSKLLQVLKSYASRALNERCARPESGTWWTSSGSTRKLGDDGAIVAAARYVREQEYVLARCKTVAPADWAIRPRGTSVPRSPKSVRTHDESYN
jgi:REP element-mobilizing transposase RayT